jgi:hypothetical protein
VPSTTAQLMFLSLSEIDVVVAASNMVEVVTVEVVDAEGPDVDPEVLSRPVACCPESVGPGLSASPIRIFANSWVGLLVGVGGCAIGSAFVCGRSCTFPSLPSRASWRLRARLIEDDVVLSRSCDALAE